MVTAAVLHYFCRSLLTKYREQIRGRRQGWSDGAEALRETTKGARRPAGDDRCTMDYQIQIFEIRPELHVAGCLPAYPLGTGTGTG